MGQLGRFGLGYEIASSVGSADISSEALLSQLTTQTVGRAIRVVDETTSTIDEAREWLADGAVDGAVLVALTQSDGRGRHGRSWASPLGGLWMTILLRPECEAKAAGRLGIGMALATAGAVESETGCRIDLKWPNDLYVGPSKVGGVLVEAHIQRGRIETALVSLGLNVNISLAELPPSVRAVATTLQHACGHDHDLRRITTSIIAGFERMLPAIYSDGEPLATAWKERDALYGKEVSAHNGGNLLYGRAHGIDPEGKLVLIADEGNRHFIIAGDVTLTGEIEP